MASLSTVKVVLTLNLLVVTKLDCAKYRQDLTSLVTTFNSDFEGQLLSSESELEVSETYSMLERLKRFLMSLLGFLVIKELSSLVLLAPLAFLNFEEP